MYDDETLICRDCSASFTFTSGEQEFYARKGFESAPSRCPECRKANGRGGSGYSGGSARGGYSGGSARGGDSGHNAGVGPARPEVLFPAVCAQCGRDTQASARLILGDGTIYCSECMPRPTEAASTSTGGWREIR